MAALSEAFLRQAGERPGHLFLSTSDARLSYGDAAVLAEAASTRLAALKGRAVGISGTSVDSLILLLALDAVGCRICVMPRTIAPQAGLIAELGIHARVISLESPAENLGDDQGYTEQHEDELVLFTSGTTGAPKAVMHRISNLLAQVHRSPELGTARWLFPYEISSFAGLQVFLHVVANGGNLSLATLATVPIEQAVRIALRDRVTHISGTPSFFRFLLAALRPQDKLRFRPRQFTLGGEVVDQPLLDQLKQRFPEARLTHIYASSEMGPCFSVHDGRAGFPAALLDDASLPVQLSVRDGELLIRPKGALFVYLNAARQLDAEGWFATGDLVDAQGDRYVFVGRKSERINVGGVKVAPAQVEAVLLDVPGVAFAKVYGVPSSLLGQLVKADVVLDARHDREVVQRRIRQACAARLPDAHRPRLLNFVAAPALLANGKIQRA